MHKGILSAAVEVDFGSVLAGLPGAVVVADAALADAPDAVAEDPPPAESVTSWLTQTPTIVSSTLEFAIAAGVEPQLVYCCI